VPLSHPEPFKGFCFLLVSSINVNDDFDDGDDDDEDEDIIRKKGKE